MPQIHLFGWNTHWHQKEFCRLTVSAVSSYLNTHTHLPLAKEYSRKPKQLLTMTTWPLTTITVQMFWPLSQQAGPTQAPSEPTAMQASAASSMFPLHCSIGHAPGRDEHLPLGKRKEEGANLTLREYWATSSVTHTLCPSASRCWRKSRGGEPGPSHAGKGTGPWLCLAA